GFITFVLGVLSVLVSLFHQQIIELFQPKKRIISGSWEGDGILRDNESDQTNKIIFRINLEVVQKGLKIKFSGSMQSDLNPNKQGLKGRGRRIGDFYRISYRNKDSNVENFGLGIFKLMPNGKAINGIIVARRMTEDVIGIVDFELTKLS
ncbi:MAG: hypothetical protein AAF388_16520, partial [Bacteroidota bacterium]